MTGLAVLCMGPQGQMIGLRAGWFSYLLALVFRVCRSKMPQASVVGMVFVQQARTYPPRDIGVERAVFSTRPFYLVL